MAFGRTELILMLRAQNQASATIRRVANDVRALQAVEDTATRRRDLAATQEIAQLRGAELSRRMNRLRIIETANALGQEIGQLNRLQTARRAALEAGPARDPLGRFVSMKPMQTAIAATDARLAGLNRELDQHVRVIERMPQSYHKFYGAQSLLADTMVQTTRLTASNTLRLDKSTDALSRFDQAANLKNIERVQLMGRTIAHMGRMAQLGGLALTFAFGMAAKSAADFSSAITLAASQARDLNATWFQTRVRAQEVNDQVMTLMRRFPASAQELADSAYEVYSGINLMNNGITDTTRAMNIMATANKAAVAGQEDLAAATSVVVTVANNFGDSSQELAHNMDVAFRIIRFGRMRLSEFNEMLNKIAPAAKSAGQSLQNVGGAMAYLTTVMPSQRQVATGLARLLELIRHPDIQRGLEEFGVSVVDSTGAMRPFMDIMKDMHDMFPEWASGAIDTAKAIRVISMRGREARTGRPGLGLISSIEARRAATLIIRNYADVDRRQRQITRSTNEMNNAYAALNETAGVKWRRFVNRMRASVLEFGVKAIPVFERIGEMIEGLVNRWNSLDQSTKDSVARFAAISGVFLLVGGTIAALGGGLMSMVGMFAALFGVRGLSKARLEKFGRFAVLAGGLVRTLGVLATLGAIGLVINAYWTGDASVKTLIMSMLAGAVAGFAIGGPIGAAIGGIVIPLGVMFAAQKGRQAETGLEAGIEAELERVRKQAGELGPGIYEVGAPTAVRQKFEAEARRLGTTVYEALRMDPSQTRKILNDAYNAGEITGFQYRKGLMLTGMTWDQAIIEQNKALLEQGTYLKEHQKVLLDNIKGHNRSRLKEEKKTVKGVITTWDEYWEADKKFRAAQKKRAKEIPDITKQATKEAKNTLLEIGNVLLNKWNEIRTANQLLMGEIFQGPHMTGEAMNVAEEWGIKAGMADLQKDLDMQLKNFNEFNQAIADLAAAGAPPELLEQIRAAGPEALENIKILANASPAELRKYFGTWQKTQTAINKQTKIQFNEQLKQWKKYGKDIMLEILTGARSEQVKLENYFRGMAKEMFPTLIKDMVAEAIREAEVAGQIPVRPEEPNIPPPEKPWAPPKPTGVSTYVDAKTDITVYANGDESVTDAGRRAVHQWKNAAREQQARIAQQWGIAPRRRGGR
jgi:TP901 family phage tail tape measure protein